MIKQGNQIGDAVINISLSGPPNWSLTDLTNECVRSGIPIVVAAGNSNRNAFYESPANAEMAVTVGAIDQAPDRRGSWRASYSNWGPGVNIWAPGTDIKSLDYEREGYFVRHSGTSMGECNSAMGESET
jgi:subtilisin family serine protease